MHTTAALTVALLLAAAFVAAAPGDRDAAAAAADAADVRGRGHSVKTMNPYMLIPQLISLGFAPIVLANLKMMVMSALMVNNMALNAAIFMTVRNMVFGPRPKVRYVNYGYRKQQHRHGGDDRPRRPHHRHHDRLGEQQQQQQQQSSWDETQSTVRRKRAAVT